MPRHLPLEGEGTPYRLAALATSPAGGSMRREQYTAMAPPPGELSAEWLTEGGKKPQVLQTVNFLSLRQNLRFCHFPRQREA